MQLYTEYVSEKYFEKKYKNIVLEEFLLKRSIVFYEDTMQEIKDISRNLK